MLITAEIYVYGTFSTGDHAKRAFSRFLWYECSVFEAVVFFNGSHCVILFEVIVKDDSVCHRCHGAL